MGINVALRKIYCLKHATPNQESPPDAAIVSAACDAGESPSPMATAIPPWAHAVFESASVPFVTRRTAWPSEASRQADQSPAMPVPTTRGRDNGYCPLAAFTAAVNAGTTSKRSPTMP